MKDTLRLEVAFCPVLVIGTDDDCGTIEYRTEFLEYFGESRSFLATSRITAPVCEKRKPAQIDGYHYASAG